MITVTTQRTRANPFAPIYVDGLPCRLTAREAQLKGWAAVRRQAGKIGNRDYRGFHWDPERGRATFV